MIWLAKPHIVKAILQNIVVSEMLSEHWFGKKLGIAEVQWVPLETSNAVKPMRLVAKRERCINWSKSWGQSCAK